jgi:protoporphyrinogen oxidase
MAKIVIIGAGLTGLSTAYHLEAQGFFDYTLLEKEAEVGGLCRSVTQDGFTFDYAGHFLHINDEYFRSFINNVVTLSTLDAIQRQSFIYSHGIHTPYPFQMNLYGLPIDVIAECIEGFVHRSPAPTSDLLYHDWVMHHFGTGLGKHFFFPYQEKLFAHDLATITSSWTGRFVPPTTLRDLLRGALVPTPEKQVGYNAHFWYPRQGGIAHLPNAIAQHLVNPIRTNHAVTAVDLRTKRITCDNGHTEPFDLLVNTMPLDLLLQKLREPATLSVSAAAHHLICNSVINFNLGLQQPPLTNKNWIYYPEPNVPFYRLVFPHTCSPAMVPHGYSSLSGEWAYTKKPFMQQKEITSQALSYAKKLWNISDETIATHNILHLDHAYVIYDTWREKHINRIHTALNDYQVYSIGRYGAWKYASMQEAILDGKATAESLLATTPRHTLRVPQKKVYTEVNPS